MAFSPEYIEQQRTFIREMRSRFGKDLLKAYIKDPGGDHGERTSEIHAAFVGQWAAESAAKSEPSDLSKIDNPKLREVVERYGIKLAYEVLDDPNGDHGRLTSEVRDALIEAGALTRVGPPNLN